MMRKQAFIIALLIFSAQFAFSQVVRKYSNAFLNIGVGARGLSMSNAQTASVNDITAAYWNPSGILNINTANQVALMHAEYFAGIAKYDYAAYAHKIDSSSALAFSLIRFGVDDIPNTIDLIDPDGNINYDNITSFSVSDYAFLFSYARKMPIAGLNVGANAKIIYRQVGNFAHAWGFGFDAGAQYRKNNWLLGATAKDITSTFNAWSYTLTEHDEDVFLKTGNEIPENGLELTLPQLILGGGRKFTVFDRFHILPEVDFNMTFDGMRNTLIKSDPISIDPHAGMELNYLNMIFLRLGIGNFQYKEDVKNVDYLSYEPDFGVGIKYKFVELDYALTNALDKNFYSNIFSLRFDFNQIGNNATKPQ